MLKQFHLGTIFPKRRSYISLLSIKLRIFPMKEYVRNGEDKDDLKMQIIQQE
jgi:hypothetical protein